MQLRPLGPTLEQREKLESLGIDVDALHLAATVYGAAIAGVNRLDADVIRPLGISHSGFVLLMSLWLFGPKEPRELARIQGVAVPSITSLVNTLERRGLVARKRSEVDGRLVTVSVTDAGIELAGRGQLGADRLERRFAAIFSPSERAAFQGYLDRYLVAIENEQVPSQSPDPGAAAPRTPRSAAAGRQPRRVRQPV